MGHSHQSFAIGDKVCATKPCRCKEGRERIRIRLDRKHIQNTFCQVANACKLPEPLWNRQALSFQVDQQVPKKNKSINNKYSG